MTLYELLKKVSFILAKSNADELFEYIIHSMDYNGGFLRSRYCYWEKILSDFECGSDLKTILVTLRSPFDFCNSTQYYEEGDFTNSTFTLLKMQIFLYDLSNKEHLEQEIMWSCGVGFSYPIKVDLINESFEILPAMNLSAKIETKNKAKRKKRNVENKI
ncbi:hypothetical protein FYJ79_04550 [Sharpea azabuensis]|uniref:Uncharacterized protein n=1 Tax=Sharpea porci TaxID=2652286 RepID=A0A844FTX6_9FIRM|nr:hypothetical protein [Sharpea porci]MST88850.1 hypothetical protein [Sharpea porci]